MILQNEVDFTLCIICIIIKMYIHDCFPFHVGNRVFVMNINNYCDFLNITFIWIGVYLNMFVGDFDSLIYILISVLTYFYT